MFDRRVARCFDTFPSSFPSSTSGVPAWLLHLYPIWSPSLATLHHAARSIIHTPSGGSPEQNTTGLIDTAAICPQGIEVWRRGPSCSPQRCGDACKGRGNDIGAQGPQCADRVQLRLAQNHKRSVESCFIINGWLHALHRHLLTLCCRWCHRGKGDPAQGQV